MVQVQRWRLEEGLKEMKDGMRNRMKKGLAALAEPKDKVTRADVIAGAKMNKRQKRGRSMSNRSGM
jgi:hypothetical protein